MGYSVYAITTDKEAAIKMAKYLRSAVKDHWLPHSLIATNFESPLSSLFYASLGSKRYQVGFNYNCPGDIEHALILDIVKWAAQTLGLGYYCYDGNDLLRIDGKSSIDRVYEMPEVTNVAAKIIVRAAKAISRKDINEAKRRLQSVKDGWVHHGE